MRLGISGIISGFGIFILASILIVAGSGAFALKMLRVGGPVYAQIIQGKDLVADILPPPLYGVEAYLETNLLRDDLAGAQQHIDRLNALGKDYGDRLQVWKDADLPSEIKQDLTVDSDAAASRFWSEIQERYIPAIQRKDEAAARESFRELSRAYAAHRKVVDKIVLEANELSAKAEMGSENKTYWFIGAMAGASVAVFLMVAAAIVAMRNRLAMPLGIFSQYIPCSRQNPKLLRVDDAEVVGDRITKFWPVFGDFFAQEGERRFGEFSVCGVSLVVRQMLVHCAP
jgi:hypothetical protein